MKLSAIAQRGSRKDFVDTYALGIEYRPLREMIGLYRRKYSVEDMVHVLYSLAYFDDAEQERMPKMVWKTDWRVIKETIQGWLREFG